MLMGKENRNKLRNGKKKVEHTFWKKYQNYERVYLFFFENEPIYEYLKDFEGNFENFMRGCSQLTSSVLNVEPKTKRKVFFPFLLP